MRLHVFQLTHAYFDERTDICILFHCHNHIALPTFFIVVISFRCCVWYDCVLIVSRFLDVDHRKAGLLTLSCMPIVVYTIFPWESVRLLAYYTSHYHYYTALLESNEPIMHIGYIPSSCVFCPLSFLLCIGLYAISHLFPCDWWRRWYLHFIRLS